MDMKSMNFADFMLNAAKAHKNSGNEIIYPRARRDPKATRRDEVTEDATAMLTALDIAKDGAP
jgi:hypothetical protein